MVELAKGNGPAGQPQPRAATPVSFRDVRCGRYVYDGMSRDEKSRRPTRGRRLGTIVARLALKWRLRKTIASGARGGYPNKAVIMRLSACFQPDMYAATYLSPTDP